MFSRKEIQRKPKIVFIHPALGESLGGSQIFVLELVERLKDRCDITILSASRINSFCKPVFSFIRRNAANQNNRFYRFAFKHLRKFTTCPDIVLEHLSSFMPVFYELMKGDYDVIMPNNDWGGLLVANVAKKLKGTPIIFTEHCGYMADGKIASRNLKFNPDKYVVLSQEMMFWVKKYFPKTNVEFIPNGVDFEKFNSNVKPKFIDLEKPIFLSAGRYYSNKRLDLSIEAVAKLNKGSLLILTSGDNIETLNQKGADMLGPGRFKVITVPYRDMAGYYAACDVFTLPSKYEPFGLVYLEAMACNKPVVAPNDFSRMEIIGDAGVLCDVTDIDAYAEALAQAANKDYGNFPLEQAQKFSWDKTADMYYETILFLMGANDSVSSEKPYGSQSETVCNNRN